MGLVSLFQATSLRDRYYTLQERVVILETALDDIARISASRADQSERHRLIVGIVNRLRDDRTL
jgi:methionine synthase I (cobalamin-dependent)